MLLTSIALASVLEWGEFRVCGVALRLELAQTERSRSVGLMYRTEVPTGTGMLFAYPRTEVLHFWMKNVPMDIDIGFFDSKGKLVHSLTMQGTEVGKPEYSYPTYSSIKPAQYAVEVQKGFFEGLGKKKTGCRLQPLPDRRLTP